MKLSMWLIVERLEKYAPKYYIVDGEARISGVRFFSGENMVHFDPQYVYLCLESDADDAFAGLCESYCAHNGHGCYKEGSDGYYCANFKWRGQKEE